MIDILIPVLGRPQNAPRVVESIQSTTTVPYEIWFLCSAGDDRQIEAALASEASYVNIFDYGGRHEYPRKMNHGYRRTHQPFLLLGADDVDFQPGWDVEALRVAEKTQAGVIGTYDGANRLAMKGHFSTHPLVRRSYADDPGASLDGPGLCSEAYDHNYTDRELAGLAQSRNQWAFAPRSRILHHRRRSDATYLKGASNFRADHQTFIERAALWGNVGVRPQERRRQRTRR